MLSKIEQHWRHLILGKNRSPLSTSAKRLLRLISWPYKVVIALRNRAYDIGIFHTHTVPEALVISVGNLVVGGTGKTPFILKLSEELSDLPIAILSRGYRSAAERQQKPVFLSKGNGPFLEPDQCGDEPFLLSSRLPKATVVVGRDRLAAAQMAVSNGARLILLDDGLQHRRLARDINIVILDAEDPFGLGFHLPRGFLREDISGLRRADLVIVNHISHQPLFDHLKRQIHTHTEASVVGTELRMTGVYDLQGKLQPSLKNKRVGIFSGIGKPEKFRQTVQRSGAQIIDELALADHLEVSGEALKTFAKRCLSEGAELLVCTEKDKVKLDSTIETALPIAWIKIDLNVCAGLNDWNNFLAAVRQRAKNQD